MNAALIPLLTLFFVFTLGRSGGAENSSTLVSSIENDGSFKEWRIFKTGWKETGATGAPSQGDIDIKEFLYKNDGTYLYLFFKSTPTVQERYDKSKTSGIFAYLYIDTDSDKKTGASEADESGNLAMLGTDIRIWVPIGVFAVSSGDGGTRKGCSVSYEIKRWNSATKDFSIEVRREDSVHGTLIGHGKDGVEMALLLSDLKKSKGDRFDFICLEWANNSPEYANRLAVHIE